MRPRWRARRRERVISSGRSHRWWRINARRCSWSCSKASPTARSLKCRACRLVLGCRGSRAPACRSRPISMASAPRFAVSNKSRKKTMIDRNSPVTEDELHAYVDDEIAADRRGAVEAWLASHPEDAARVAQWQAQAEPNPARYGMLASEPLPARFDLDRLTRGLRSWRTVAAAAVIVAFLAGGVVGWMAHGASAAAPSPFETFTAQALDAHRVYVVEVRHPVEVTGAERPHLVQWLSERLHYQPRIPDLEPNGLKLVGGR